MTTRQDARPNAEELAQRLRARDGRGLRTSKPTTADGLTRWAWRMARFHSGADVTMPVTCYFDLQNWADVQAPGASVCGILNEQGKALTAELDRLVDQVLEILGCDRFAAARRWAPLLGRTVTP